MIFVQASNIHCGGGAVLLTELLDAAEEESLELTVFADERFISKSYKVVKVSRVKPTIWSRICCEIKLSYLSRKYPKSDFIFFGNLPPLFSFRADAFLFFQNVLLVSDSSANFSLKVQFKHKIEKLWLSIGAHRIKAVLVQTNYVKELFQKRFPKANILISPFVPALTYNTVPVSEKKWDYIYVASTDPHKNHKNLILAWIGLKKEGYDFSLLLTGKFTGDLEALLQKAKYEGCRIETKPNLSHLEILKLYECSRALIYPSLMESFGLPLLESAAVGTPIVASDLPYVHEVVIPQESFNPTSVDSIIQSIKRFSKKEPEIQRIKIKINRGRDFLKTILLN